MTALRLVAWNVCGGFSRKTLAVRGLDADVAILSEVGAETASLLPDASVEWIGDPGRRGLAVVGLNGWRVRRLDQIVVGDRLFLPTSVEREGRAFTLIGACVKNADGYAAPTMRALDVLAPLLRDGPAILAGDFNLTARLDPRRSDDRKAGPVMDRLRGLGLRSAWHERSGEAFGQETEATYFHHWLDTPATRFHIDYAFVSSDLVVERAEIGHPDVYLTPRISDHMPLTVEVRSR